jgi:hypothetical protein
MVRFMVCSSLRGEVFMTAPSCIQGNGPHGIDPFGNPIEFNSKSIPEGSGPSDTLQIANISALFLNGRWGCGEVEKEMPSTYCGYARY